MPIRILSPTVATTGTRLFAFWPPVSSPYTSRRFSIPWCIHEGSTARNLAAKSYIHSSQRNVLNRFVRGRGKPDRYRIDYSPLYERSPDWWIRRKHEDPRPLSVVLFGSAAASRVDELEKPTHLNDRLSDRECLLAS